MAQAEPQAQPRRKTHMPHPPWSLVVWALVVGLALAPELLWLASLRAGSGDAARSHASDMGVARAFVVMAALGGVALGALVLIWPVVKRSRAWRDYAFSLSTLGACATMWVLPLSGLGWRLIHDDWRAEWADVARHGQPIIDALAEYHASHREYPEELEALVPNCLAAIPATGMARHPRLNYARADDRSLMGREGFELYISTSKGMLNWDRFFYWPSQDYPNYVYGGVVEEIAGWAYVHE